MYMDNENVMNYDLEFEGELAFYTEDADVQFSNIKVKKIQKALIVIILINGL